MSVDDRPILLVDGMNLFVRAWSVYPTMSANGYQMGGTIGFLKILSRIIGESKPRAVFVAWEGGGSARRRKLFKEYKLGRAPTKLNRYYEDDLPDTEENRHHQLLTLLSMVKKLPVCQLYVQDCEGDDVIAVLCRNMMKDESKIIVSSDKDMYQLVDENTKIYSLHKKTYVTKKDIEDEYKISVRNFALAKALCGDKSDNIEGIKGMGFKKVIKMFPFLGLDEDITLQRVVEYSYAHQDEGLIYKRVIEGQDRLKLNFKLIYLSDTMISADQISRVDHVVSTFVPKVNKMGLMKLLIKEGLNDLRVNELLFEMNCIERVPYGENK